VPRKANADIYAKYKALADQTPEVHFLGRLATYKYYNMDQIVGQALTSYAKIAGMKRLVAVAHSAGAVGQSAGNGKLHNVPIVVPQVGSALKLRD
jgi:UDP-galactopyranose mutase